ncbi:LysR substrate-binding domain-containing protein [Paragemmobacter straminiformis]|uniref:LysR family transcriptional regulator n=1 Tax=Paragemmobacter straminiformis TaxID=2045119 RepID=A0A842I7D7_9RHOB|nr:LysR substrate-binding domain-containing protein [Gemmobacter straminiformis]MBC2835770.1 LysR family transcriptional regulator [Gemmobacter straminiformis]
MYSRRNFPSLSGLLALEAVARLGTASAAAAELNLTAGAISRALQEAEATLGQTLLVRDRQRLRLTPAARDYVLQVRRALDGLTGAAHRLRSGAGDVLTLAILPAFGMHWLAPRLPAFRAIHPEIPLNLATRLRPFDLAAEGVDAAIHYGRADWPNAEHLLLMQEEVLPVCAPAFLRAPLARAEDILTRPLLMIESRTGDWGRWLAAQGLPGQRPQAMMFDQFATMQQGAIHGLGIALLPSFLVAEDLAVGRLVPAWGKPVPSNGAYWLVWPKDVAPRPQLLAFRDWIAGLLPAA